MVHRREVEIDKGVVIILAPGIDLDSVKQLVHVAEVQKLALINTDELQVLEGAKNTPNCVVIQELNPMELKVGDCVAPVLQCTICGYVSLRSG
jgi:hypothetical protein